MTKQTFISQCDGSLCLLGGTGPLVTVRRDYAWHHRDITTGRQLRATLRAGEYAWPGGYAVYFITSDGAVLSFEAVRAELRSVLDSIRNKSNDGWRVIACDTTANTDETLYCDHTGKEIV